MEKIERAYLDVRFTSEDGLGHATRLHGFVSQRMQLVVNTLLMIVAF